MNLALSLVSSVPLKWLHTVSQKNGVAKERCRKKKCIKGLKCGIFWARYPSLHRKLSVRSSLIKFDAVVQRLRTGQRLGATRRSYAHSPPIVPQTESSCAPRQLICRLHWPCTSCARWKIESSLSTHRCVAR